MRTEASSRRPALALALALASAWGTGAPASTVVTADADVRIEWPDPGPARYRTQGLGLAVRQIFADSQGDRLILFAFGNWEGETREAMLDQAWAMYKGPLGSWNLRAGRYAVPFGLLYTFSSLRTPIATLEYLSIGMESDTGAMVSGLAGPVEYAVSVSDGAGMERWTNRDNDGFLSARAGWEGADGDLALGASVAWGKTPDMHAMDGMGGSGLSFRRLGALDATVQAGRATVRTEAIAGTADGEPVAGLYLGNDFALSARVELLSGYSVFRNPHETSGFARLGAGWSVGGLKLRGFFGVPVPREGPNEVVLQALYQFVYSR